MVKVCRAVTESKPVPATIIKGNGHDIGLNNILIYDQFEKNIRNIRVFYSIHKYYDDIAIHKNLSYDCDLQGRNSDEFHYYNHEQELCIVRNDFKTLDEVKEYFKNIGFNIERMKVTKW